MTPKFSAIARAARKGCFRLPLLVATAAFLAGVSLGAGAAGETAGALAPQEERIGDVAIHRDHGVYRQTQQRIRALNDAGRRVADYQLSKAQCWLDVSFHEYSRNDRSEFPQEALDESRRILGGLESGQDPGMATPLVNRAEKLRPDLWARHAALKNHAGFRCATQQTACAEVELVHAGNEIREAGWGHAKPYLQIAEDLTAAAEQAAASCPAEEVPAAPPVTPPVPPTVPAPEKLTLSADALFRFDKSGLADLLPQGRAELDRLARDIVRLRADAGALSIIGHADRLERGLQPALEPGAR